MNLEFKKITARAHTNIALVKYWGKTDEKMIIPQNSSLSLTLDQFFTDTSVLFSNELKADEFFLNGTQISSKRVVSFMNIVRNKAGINYFATIKSENNVPTSAGLASSASAFAALAAAASKAAGLTLNLRELSKLARRGSGSASRSIFGNFVEWHRGNNNQTSFAEPIPFNKNLKIAMIAIVLKSTKKEISSRKGMAISVATSPYYDAWKQVTEQDLKIIKRALRNDDFTTLGRTAETNAMRMHALTLSSDPDFLYLNGDSIKVMNLVKNLRQNGIECYYTMDAGPNVKIICQDENCRHIKASLQQTFPNCDVIISHPGPGIKYI